MLDFLSGIDIEKVLLWGGAIVGAASLIANVTPTETDNKIVNLLGKLMNFLAANFRKPQA
jgi:hypothetical protein